MPSEKQRGATHKLRVSVSLIDIRKDDNLPSVFAYLFSSSGDLLDRRPLEKDSRAQLEAPAVGERRSFRVVIGPETGAETGVYAELMRRGAVEQSLIHDLGKDKELGIVVRRPDWLKWLLGWCCAKGRVLKRVGTGPNAVDLNVCGATVEVYEVDPWWYIIERIPGDILKRLREIVLEEVHVIPMPWPPDPGPEAWPPDPVPWMEDVLVKRRKGLSDPTRIVFSSELKLIARNGSDLAFKNSLTENMEVFFPIFCWHWPWFVWKIKVCETITDCYGRFTCCFYNGWLNPDTPDLWFRVRQTINGTDTVIYEKHPIACNTFWNYACGSEVKLYVSNPNARTCCDEPPIDADGDWVILEAIGTISPHAIRGTSLDPLTSVAIDGHDRGWTRGNGPFGGLIRPRLRFRDTLRSKGVLYYRVSWAPTGTDPADLGAWQVLATPVGRHYIHEVGGHPVYSTWNVGPKSVGTVTNLFEIPPSAPPVGDWAIPPGYELDDLTSAYFNTYSLVPAASAGKYDIKVELFDTAGNMVNLATKGVKWYVPSLDDLSGTIFTDDASLPGLNLVHGNAFVMTLQVDNNFCTAVIAPPTIGANGANPDCGGLEYHALTDSVLMAFEASHPNQFATYAFNVYRGHANGVGSDSGPVGIGSHSISSAVSDLLGTCQTAAFSENLWVYATATDGWRRLWEYDRGDVFAFMLEPAKPTPTT